MCRVKLSVGVNRLRADESVPVSVYKECGNRKYVRHIVRGYGYISVT